MATEETNLPPTTPSTPTSSAVQELVNALEKASSLEEWLMLAGQAVKAGLVEEVYLETPSLGRRKIWERKPAEPPELDK